MNRADLAPGAALGVFGGGQLARMFVHAAQRMGYDCVVLEPQLDSPGARVADRHLAFGYDDPAGWLALGQQALAVTTEFENVGAAALQALAHHAVVAPSAASVAICQDRVAEKTHFLACGVPCAPYVVVDAQAQFDAVASTFFPGILKTARLGYDGKGQRRVNSRSDLQQAWQELGGVTCVLEQCLPLQYELSVIVARGHDGQVVHFPVQQNLHREGILAVTQVPAPDVSVCVQEQAIAAAQRIAAELGYVGVLCVEFFVLADGRLVANEMAPRPHNSGHYTLDACDISQFDLQVRTLTRRPLWAPRLHSCAVMINVLGDLWFGAGCAEPVAPRWDGILAWPGVHLHLYGKTAVRRGRKMGHITVTADSSDRAREVALQVAQYLGLASW